MLARRRLRIGSLFTGIGLIDYAFERAGVGQVAWQCEIADFPRKVLARRYPHVPLYGDVLSFREPKTDKSPRRRKFLLRPPEVDILMGGSPCQGFSASGDGAGLKDPRSGLWEEMWALAAELSPPIVFLENSPRILTPKGKPIFDDLAELGYRIDWDCIPAAARGAPHMRDRAFVVAHRTDHRPFPEWSIADTPDGQWAWMFDCPPTVPPRSMPNRKPRVSALGNAVCVPVIEHVARGLVLPPTPGKVRRCLGPLAALERLPRAGAVVDGVVYEYVPGASQADAEDFALSVHAWWLPPIPTKRKSQKLMPTLTYNDAVGGPGHAASAEGGQNLRTAIGGLLPTLTHLSYGNNVGGAAGRVGPVRQSLDSIARAGLLPTLTVKGNYNVAGQTEKSGDGLATRVKLLATLIASSHRSGCVSEDTMQKNSRPLQEQLGGTLNPRFCEWFLGAPYGWSDPLPPDVPLRDIA